MNFIEQMHIQLIISRTRGRARAIAIFFLPTPLICLHTEIRRQQILTLYLARYQENLPKPNTMLLLRSIPQAMKDSNVFLLPT